METKTASQAQMLFNRLDKRFRHLKKWAQRTGAGVFRLYDKDIPEIPLVLDFYGNCIELHSCSVAGALYERPYEKDEREEEKWLQVMKESASSALGIPAERFFIKQRKRQRGLNQYEKISEKSFTQIINEDQLSFKVNLSDYLDTGIYPDRRLLRAMVRSESTGKKVLNLFSYTGSFSVYAAAGGAVSVDSVDLSNTYLGWARENFSLNGFSADLLPQMNEDRQRITRMNTNKEIGGNSSSIYKLIRSDVLDFIEKAIIAKKRWDIIILDPPAFSNSKKMTDNFDLNRDIAGLLKKCLKLLAADGKIFLSINVRKSPPEAAALEAEIKAKVTDITGKITDEDFKGRKTPQGFIIRKWF